MNPIVANQQKHFHCIVDRQKAKKEPLFSRDSIIIHLSRIDALAIYAQLCKQLDKGLSSKMVTLKIQGILVKKTVKQKKTVEQFAKK